MIKTFFYCCFVSIIILIPSALIFSSYWKPYLDETPPQIQILNPSERVAIGKNGGSLKVVVADESPGLDEVIVRIRQLREDHQLIRKKLNGQKKTDLTIDIPAINPDEEGRYLLSEGSGELEVVAFDRSFYNNKGSVETKAFVDLKMPRIEPISSQHNLRQGGSQLIFYFAEDENLKYSGVRAGDKIFPGFSAAQLDPIFAKKNIYAALYSVPVESNLRPQDIALIAEDIGGNKVEMAFYNKIARRSFRNLRLSNSRLHSWLTSFDPPGSDYVSEQSVNLADQKLKAAIDASQLSRGLQRIEATALAAYADRFVLADSEKFPADSFIFTGLSRSKALQEGEVQAVLKNSNGTYTIKIMHALGLASEYTGLSSVIVQTGQQVKAGEDLGALGDYLKLRVLLNHVAVDPTEWWSQDWVASHVIDKISETKRALGIIEE